MRFHQVGKRRTREHVIADLSVNHLERFVFRCGWTIQRTTHDYGLDLLMETYNQNGERQNGRVLFQLKATDSIKLRDDGKTIAVRLEWRDIQAWRGDPMPVILVVYDAKADQAYWIHVQQYFAGRREKIRNRVGATTTVYIPRDQLVSESAVVHFAALRDAVMARIRGVIHYEE